MTITSGIGGQAGFGIESTVGTRVVSTRFPEILKESIKFHQNYVVGKGIVTGRRVARRRHKTTGYVDGSITMEMAPQSMAILFKHMLGAVNTTGANPYSHAVTPGALDGLGLTWQFNRPDVSGTDRVFDYSGMQCTSWDLGCKANEVAELTTDWYGLVEVTNQSLAAVSYPAGWAPFVCVGAVVSIAGSAYDVWDVTLHGDNGLATGRHQLRTTTPAVPKKSLEANTRSYTGVINSDFVDLTAYARATAQTAAAFSCVFTQGTTTLTIAGNVEFDTDTVNLEGEDTLKQGLPFTFLSSTSDAAAITVTVVNADAAA